MDTPTSVARWLARRLDNRAYYGWVIVGVIFTANTAAFAINPTFGLFVAPLEHEFGWDRGTLGRSLTLGTVVGAGVAPLLGWLSDRIGVRTLFVAGGTLSALALVLLSQVQQAWQYNLLLGLCYGVLNMGIGSVLGAVAVSRWFARRRGRAMGIVMMGASSSGLVFVLLHSVLIATVGWRIAYAVQGVLTLLMVAVPAWLFLADAPQALGAAEEPALPAAPAENSTAPPESATASAKDRTAPAENVPTPEPGAARTDGGEPAWTLRGAARTRAFWVTLAGVMLGSFPVIGYFAHAVPILISHGVAPNLAATAWAVFFTTGILAKFVWGFAIERLRVRYSLAICFAAEVLGVILLTHARTPAAALVWAVCNGLGHAPYLQLLAMVWAEYFGRRSLGAIFGAVQPFIVFSASLGPWIAGWFYDSAGSYTPFLYLATAMTALAGIVFFFDTPPRPPAAP